MKCKVKYCLLFLSFFSIAINSQSADYYWIGGSGNWSDFTNWATESGGAVIHLSIPTPSDNVYFDNNSFTAAGEMININVETATCNNFIWETTSFQAGIEGSGILKVFGSFILNNSLIFNYAGALHFETNETEKTLNFANKQLGNINFNGISGSWNLESSLNCQNIYFSNGSFNTNGYNINCQIVEIVSASWQTLNLENSIITATEKWAVSTYFLNLISANSEIRTVNFSGGNNLIYNKLTFLNTENTATLTANNCSFQEVFFPRNGSINGNNRLINTTLSKGKVYTFAANSTTTIVSTFFVDSNCLERTELLSSDPEQAAFFYKAGGSVIVQNVSMKDIHCLGNANFQANNIVDLGNNSGWNIIAEQPKNYYWIGGTGNWSNPNHWSLESGGAATNCIPSAIDNVFFDSNSFFSPAQSVIISTETAKCNNMFWENTGFAPSLTGSSEFFLKIYGSLEFSADMLMIFAGKIYFHATEPSKTIKMAGQKFANNAVFRGHGGEWTLLDDFSVGQNNTIFLERGHLKTNGNKITCYEFNSEYSYPRALSLGASLVEVFYNWKVNANNFTFDAGTSLIKLVSQNANMFGATNLTYYDILFFDAEGVGSFQNDNNSFHYVNFNSNAFIEGSNIYDILTISAGKNYTIKANSEQTILTDFVANGNCISTIYIQTNIEGEQATFIKQNGAINVDYVILHDLNAEGGAIFTATNSIDFGNNSGWIIYETQARDLYWVGGSGEWNDMNNWALVSGGIGGECIPSPKDNVFFDENSFSSENQVIITKANQLYCKNMDWRGVNFNPAFTNFGTSYFLNIHGSLFLDEQVQFNFNGQMNFLSSEENQIVSTANKVLNCYVYFSGTGEWNIQGDFACENNVFFENGSLNTNSFDIYCNGFHSVTTTNRTLNLANSNITVNGYWDILSNNLTFDAGNSVIYFLGAGTLYNNGNTALQYNNVEFLDRAGISILDSYQTATSFNNVIFKGSAYLYGNNVYNNLTFSPNNTYKLQSFRRQTIIENLNIRGNNCFAIELQSNRDGLYAEIFKQSGSVSGMFINMKYVNALGGADFFMGTGSSNINNTCNGWIAGNDPGFAFGLGRDSILIAGDTLFLDVGGFNGNDDTVYEWNTGENSEIIEVTNAARYSIIVNYHPQCPLVYDTVDVFFADIQHLNCFNDASGSISINADPTAIYSFNWASGENSQIIENLEAGIYSIQITDQTNSVSTHSFEITQPDELILQLDIDYITCANANDAKISATATGGTGTLLYSINNQDFTENSVFENLSSGNYFISVKDNNGCIKISPIIEIENPEEIEIQQVSIQNISCFNANDGIIEIVSTGGSQPLVYQLNSIEQNFGLFEFLSPNIYNIQVSDINNCSVIYPEEIILSNPNELIINTLTSNNIICNNANNGEIICNASGGTGNLSYSIDSGLSEQPSGIFSNLPEGDFQVLITDENNCSIESEIIEITNPELIEATVNTSNISCYNFGNGEIHIFAVGGTGFLNYSIDGINFQQTPDFLNIGAGNYNIFIRDENNCELIISDIEFINPAEIIIEQANIQYINCYNETNGAIEILASGGTPPILYSIDNWNSLQSNGLFINLLAGEYVVRVTDSNNCPEISTQPIILDNPPEIIINQLVVQDISCFNASDGEIYVLAEGGSGNLLFAINGGNFQPENSFINLTFGSYIIEIQDEHLCSIQSEIIELTNPDELIIENIEIINCTCFGSNNGEIIIEATGGSGQLFYSINGSDFQIDNHFENLAAGNFNISVTDQNNCQSNSNNLVITEPTQVIINEMLTTDISCNNFNDGSLEVFSIGGTGSHLYSLNSSSYQSSNFFENLAQGNYYIQAKDQNNCLSPVSTFQITNPPILSASTGSFTSTVSCHNFTDGQIYIHATGGVPPYLFSLNNSETQADSTFMNLSAGTYYVTIFDNNNCQNSTETVTIINPDELIISNISSENCDCYNSNNGEIIISAHGGSGTLKYCLNNGIFQESSVFSNLLPAVYSATVQDIRECSSTINNIEITEPLDIIYSIDYQDITCHNENDGIINISASGGSGILSYFINNQFSENSIFTGLSNGDYNIVISDNNLCTKVLPTIILNNPPLPELSISAEILNIQFGNSVQLQATQNNFYTYIWHPAEYLNNQFIFNPIATPVANTTFVVEISDDKNCKNSAEINIEVSNTVCNDDYIFVPNAFTPNDNSLGNNVFKVHSLIVTSIELYVYNRWGTKVFETKDIQRGWDGSYSSEKQNPGVYVYHLKATCNDGSTFYKKGNVTLLR